MKYLMILLLFVCSHSLIAQAEKHTAYWNHKTSMYEVLPNTEGEIILLGDSITDRCEWFELLKNPNIKNRGLSGDRTSGVLDRLDEIIESKPDKVFIMIGVNDLRHDIELETVVNNYRIIVERITETSPSTEIILQSILPVNNVIGKPKTTNDKIIALNKEIQNIADVHGLIYIDLFSAFLDENNNLHADYSEDGLHINGDGYLLWAAIIQKHIGN